MLNHQRTYMVVTRMCSSDPQVRHANNVPADELQQVNFRVLVQLEGWRPTSRGFGGMQPPQKWQAAFCTWITMQMLEFWCLLPFCIKCPPNPKMIWNDECTVAIAAPGDPMRTLTSCAPAHAVHGGHTICTYIQQCLCPSITVRHCPEPRWQMQLLLMHVRSTSCIFSRHALVHFSCALISATSCL